MNFFQNTFEPIRDAFLAMPMTTRLIAGMLVLTIAIGLGLLVKGGTTTETEYLFGGRMLSETEVDSVEMSFSQAGLKLWEREGRRIRIPKKTRNEYLAALRESATLPLALRSSLQEAIDKASPFDSSEQRTSREMHAKAQDLGAKISAFPEIRWASVEYDQGERTGLSRARPQSASVLVSPEGTEPLTKARVNMIKELIRGSYAGMNNEDVVVIDTNASHLNGDWKDEDPMLRKRLEEEKSYEQKVLRALVGYGPIRVAAHAELDPTMGVEKAVLKYDSERTTLQEYSKKVDEQSTRQGPKGVPGTAPNAIGNRAATLDEPEQFSKTKEDEREATGVVGQQYELSKLAAMQVKKVTVSVGLPTSYYDRVILQDFLRENPDKTAADMPKPTVAMLQQKRTETEGKIKAAVSPLLPPVPPGADPLPLVHVWDFPDIPEPMVATGGGTGKALTWLSESWPSLAMLGLAAIAILIARSALLGGGNGTPRDFNEGFGLELPTPPQEEEDANSDENEGMQITGGSLKEELFRMVDKNPEVAANVLRSWITENAA
jgi:flagellar M-ring protein FliF